MRSTLQTISSPAELRRKLSPGMLRLLPQLLTTIAMHPSSQSRFPYLASLEIYLSPFRVRGARQTYLLRWELRERGVWLRGLLWAHITLTSLLRTWLTTAQSG